MPLEIVPSKEQLLRKKAEEKKPAPTPPSESQKNGKPQLLSPEDQLTKKERFPHKEIPIITLEKRERKGGVPVIPGDPCCAKLCEILNNKIERKKNLLNTTVALGGGRSLYKSATYRSLMYQIETLEDHRHDLKDKGNCRCIEETGAVSIIIPLVQAQQREFPLEMTGVKLVAPPPKKLKEIYQKEKSIIPPTNSCCPNACKILNEEIDKTRETLDNMELRGGPEVDKNPRYEALSAKTFALQDYRSELKNRNSCKCVE